MNKAKDFNKTLIINYKFLDLPALKPSHSDKILRGVLLVVVISLCK